MKSIITKAYKEAQAPPSDPRLDSFIKSLHEEKETPEPVLLENKPLRTENVPEYSSQQTKYVIHRDFGEVVPVKVLESNDKTATIELTGNFGYKYRRTISISELFNTEQEANQHAKSIGVFNDTNMTTNIEASIKKYYY